MKYYIIRKVLCQQKSHCFSTYFFVFSGIHSQSSYFFPLTNLHNIVLYYAFYISLHTLDSFIHVSSTNDSYELIHAPCFNTPKNLRTHRNIKLIHLLELLVLQSVCSLPQEFLVHTLAPTHLDQPSQAFLQ